MGAAKVHLTPEENAAIRKAVDQAEVHGDRYPEAFAFALLADSPLPEDKTSTSEKE